jgi:hypothetical protein
MASDGALRRYNLFRRREEQDLYCAVPEDRPVPRFVAGEEWEYRGRVVEDRPLPAGFRLDAAQVSARFNGYYLFHAVAPAHT